MKSDTPSSPHMPSETDYITENPDAPAAWIWHAVQDLLIKRNIRLSPDFTESLRDFTRTPSETDEFTVALSAFRNALLLAPNYIEEYLHFGETLTALGYPDEAISIYDDLINRFGTADE